MNKNTMKKMNGTIARMSDLFTEEMKEKLYAASLARTKAITKADIVELIEVPAPKVKITLAHLAEELLANNAKVLRGIKGIQAQKEYILNRVNALCDVTEAKRKKFLYGNYGRGGVMTAANYSDLLAVLTRAALNGNGLAMPYTRR